MERYCNYYFLLKELVRLHRELGFGENPPLPQVFSQDICRGVYGLEKWNDRKADAKDKNGKAVEIKATGSKGGTTTIDMNVIEELGVQFGGLYWMYFDFDKDEVEICFLPLERLIGIASAGKGKRTNVRLFQHTDENCRKERFRFRKGIGGNGDTLEKLGANN